VTTDLTLAAFAPVDLPAMQAVRQAAFAPVFQSFRDIVGATIAEIAFSAPMKSRPGCWRHCAQGMPRAGCWWRVWAGRSLALFPAH